MPKDKNVGKVKMVYLPNNKYPQWRWIVKKREDGRYIARTPNMGVLIRDLSRKFDKHYKPEKLLPKNISFYTKCKTRKKCH